MRGLFAFVRGHSARLRLASSFAGTMANGASRRAVGDERAALGRADDGQRGGRGMRAALGAAGNMDRSVRAFESRRGPLGQMRGASAREAICAEAQIGAPAQATTWRRGSSARTIKPSRSAAAAKSARVCGVKSNGQQCSSRRRAKTVCTGCRSRCRPIVRVKPHRHGRRRDPTPQARDPSRKCVQADRRGRHPLVAAFVSG